MVFIQRASTLPSILSHLSTSQLFNLSTNTPIRSFYIRLFISPSSRAGFSFLLIEKKQKIKADFYPSRKNCRSGCATRQEPCAAFMGWLGFYLSWRNSPAAAQILACSRHVVFLAGKNRPGERCTRNSLFLCKGLVGS